MLRKVSLGLIVALAGCGTAQLVHRTQYSGVLELQGDRGKAMDVASSEMAAHCGANNYTIVQEGYEPPGPPGGPRGPGGGMVWRVHYQCNAPAGAPASMPGAAPGQMPPTQGPPPEEPPGQDMPPQDMPPQDAPPPGPGY